MKKLFSIVIFLLGVAIITTSCNKKDDPIPVSPNVSGNPNVTYDTIKYTFNLGVIKADSTLNSSGSNSYYTSTSVYTLLLSKSIPNYITINGEIKAIQFNKNQGTFYNIQYTQIPNDVEVKIYCDYDTYQSNSHTVFGKVYTDSTIYEVTFNFNLASDPTYQVLKTLINGHTANTATISNSSADVWTPLTYEKYVSSSFKPVHSFVWYNYIGTSENTGYIPTQVPFLSMSVYNNCTFTINLHNDKMTFIDNYGNYKQYTIESVVTQKVYMNDGVNLTWCVF